MKLGRVNRRDGSISARLRPRTTRKVRERSVDFREEPSSLGAKYRVFPVEKVPCDKGVDRHKPARPFEGGLPLAFQRRIGLGNARPRVLGDGVYPMKLLGRPPGRTRVEYERAFAGVDAQDERLVAPFQPSDGMNAGTQELPGGTSQRFVEIFH